MGSWVGALERAAKSLGDLRAAANQASELEGVGKAVTAARADARALGAALAEEIREAEVLSGALSHYADAFDSSAKRANDLIGDIESAHATWQTKTNAVKLHSTAPLYAAAASSDMGPSASIWTGGHAPDPLDGLIGASNAAKFALDELWEEYEGFYTAWDEAYDAALSELARGANSTDLTFDARNFLDSLLAADDPAAVLKLWLANPDLRAELVAQHPDILGNLDGIPYDLRAELNQKRLEMLLASTPPGELKDQFQSLWDELKTSGDPRSLISFDPNGSEQVTGAIAYGDLASAGNVNVLVPGMLSNVKGIGEWGQTARDLNSRVGAGSATIAWFGYDSAIEIEEPSLNRATDGAAAFGPFLLGLDALIPNAENSVIAHSYGSTMAALAIGSRPDGLGVDKFITVGSAGFPGSDQVLANLQSDGAPRIFATRAGGDIWSSIGQNFSFGQHGTGPDSLEGATVFDSDGGVSASGEPLMSTPGHDAHNAAGDSYLMKKSESFYNIVEIVKTGEPGTEPGGEGSSSKPWRLFGY